LKLFEEKLAAHYQPSMFDAKRERVNHPGNPKRRLKDTSTIPFLAENYSALVKYSDKIH